jgi:sec-independent protein translocase protein TatC
MADEPESDADATGGADGTPDEESERPSDADGGGEGSDDEPSPSGVEPSRPVDGGTGPGDDRSGEADAGSTAPDEGGTDREEDEPSEGADDDGTIEGTGVDDRMASYAESIDMPGGPVDDEGEDDEDGGAPGSISDSGSGSDPESGSHVGGADPDDERQVDDDGGTITPEDSVTDREYDEEELEAEFGASAVDPASETEVTDGAGTARAGDEWVEDDWDEEWTDSGIVGEGPESDEEMPLAEHIEEMVGRVGVVLLVGLSVSLAVFGLGEVSQYIPSSVEIVEYLWQQQVPSPNENRPHVYGPLELLLTQLKVAGLTGLIVGLPVFVYETYLFMRPGLYPRERRYYLAAVPTSLVLALLGVLFAHFVVLPNLFEYFTFYTESAAQGNILVAYGLRDTFTLILVMMGYMAVIFQIPLFVMLAIMMGLTTREWMEERRLLFWGAFVGLSFTFVAVDPTGMAPIVIGVTMIVLFEATLALLRWTGN